MTSGYSSMSRCQHLAAYLAMVAFGVPSLVIALLGGAVWPFLDYRMYAEAKLTPDVDWLELVGHTTDGRAIPLSDDAYIVPFDSSELLRTLETLGIQQQDQALPARRALAGLLRAYEALRRAGEHDGPPLIALEVYRVRWTALPGASNYATPESRTSLQLVPLSEAQP